MKFLKYNILFKYMSKKSLKWLNNFDKIKESDWILKLLSYNNNNLSKLKNVDGVSIFISNEMLYKQLTTNIDSILEKEPLELIKELVKLREKLIEQQTYLDEFKIKIQKDTFRKYLKGIVIEDLSFINYGYIGNNENEIINKAISIQHAMNFNNKTNNILINKTDKMGMDKKQQNALSQSLKSATGWHKIDFKKHGIGSMIDILKLTVRLLSIPTSDNETEFKKNIKFLTDCFKLHLPNDEIEEIILSRTFHNTKRTFNVPKWIKKDSSISVETIRIIENGESNSLPIFLNNLLNAFSLTDSSGTSETLVLILFNVLMNMVTILEEIYDDIYDRTTKNSGTKTSANKNSADKNSADKIKTSVINGSIKESIKSFKQLIEFQIKKFFDLKKDIRLMDDQSLIPPLSYSKGRSNIYRIVGGVESIIKKENCTKGLFPIVLKDKGKSINTDETIKRLIKLFMNKTDISMGGFVLHNTILDKICLIMVRYINKIIKTKTTAIKRIDKEFQKMTKSIRLRHVQALSKHISTEFKKLLKVTGSVKQAVYNDVSSNLLMKYTEYKDKELFLMKELIKNNTYIPKIKDVKKLKDFSLIQKNLMIEYFSVKNIAYVYKLLLPNIYNTLLELLSDKGVNNKILPKKFIKDLLDEIKKIDTKFDSNKKKLNTKLINNAQKKINKNNFSNI